MIFWAPHIEVLREEPALTAGSSGSLDLGPVPVPGDDDLHAERLDAVDPGARDAGDADEDVVRTAIEVERVATAPASSRAALDVVRVDGNITREDPDGHDERHEALPTKARRHSPPSWPSARERTAK